MKKFFDQKAFLLFTLLFMFIAAVSFVAFRETEQVCNKAENYYKAVKPARQSEMLWEVVSRRFLSFISI